MMGKNVVCNNAPSAIIAMLKTEWFFVCVHVVVVFIFFYRHIFIDCVRERNSSFHLNWQRQSPE